MVSFFKFKLVDLIENPMEFPKRRLTQQTFKDNNL